MIITPFIVSSKWYSDLFSFRWIFKTLSLYPPMQVIPFGILTEELNSVHIFWVCCWGGFFRTSNL